MKKIFTVMAFSLLCCTAMQAQTASFQKEAIECLGSENDGSQTLRVTGIGKNKEDAFEQAKKDAVAAVIFDGIRSGMNGCDSRPIISEMNARRKYEDYFNLFFRDNGMYKQYVDKEVDRKVRSNVKTKNKLFKSYRITVRVYRAELKRRLQEDGIIK
ncbi:MAG: hypothetical protein IJ144_02165 [Prevotella sp.]|nr:hypothetical protein [Prevotella sp.]